MTATAIVLYVVFAGASASVVRAAAMAGVVLIARESGRAGRAAAALGWAAVVLLLVDPRLVTDAGFQLSSLATAGNPGVGDTAQRVAGGCAESVARLARRVPRRLARGAGGDAAGRPAVVRPAGNRVPSRQPRRGAAGRAGHGSVRDGVVGGMATLGGAPGLVATLLGLPAWFLLSVIVGIVQAAAALPFASATIDPPWNVATAGSPRRRCGVVAARRLNVVGHLRSARAATAVADRTPRARPTLPAACSGRTRLVPSRFPGLATTATVLVAAHRPDGTTRITVLDVGQGDAILVEGGRGGRMLVDGGPNRTGSSSSSIGACHHGIAGWTSSS